jgi:hypothetical protein
MEKSVWLPLLNEWSLWSHTLTGNALLRVRTKKDMAGGLEGIELVFEPWTKMKIV